MKLSVEKDQLLEVLQKVQSIVALRTTLPILSNVLLEASNGELKFTTTDMEVSLQTRLKLMLMKKDQQLCRQDVFLAFAEIYPVIKLNCQKIMIMRK